MWCTIFPQLHIALYEFFRDGEDWLYHRKIMNTLLLNRDFSPFVHPIKNSVGRLMVKWEASESIKPLENLESDLYRWSLESKSV